MQYAHERVSVSHVPVCSCLTNTSRCGGAVGMYFLVKRCSMLYLYANNGTFGPSPYLDVHGEADISMRYVRRCPPYAGVVAHDAFRRRGRRQYLHAIRWEDIRRLWLQHGIPTLIARKLESTVDNGGWETL